MTVSKSAAKTGLLYSYGKASMPTYAPHPFPVFALYLVAKDRERPLMHVLSANGRASKAIPLSRCSLAQVATDRMHQQTGWRIAEGDMVIVIYASIVSTGTLRQGCACTNSVSAHERRHQELLAAFADSPDRLNVWLPQLRSVS